MVDTGGLGRRAAPDPRDRRHLMAPPPATELPPFRYWQLGPVLDQGNTGTCVGHGWRDRLNAAPIKVKPTVGPDAFAIYRGACLNDEWTDNDDQDLDWGSSVRGGAKFLASLGYVGEYVWAFDVDTAVDYVLGQAPVVLGINWYSSFDRPDKHHLIRITPAARIRGGHCLLMYGANRKSGLASLQNSWGARWGNHGRCQIPLEDLDRLVREDGEACDAVELRVKP